MVAAPERSKEEPESSPGRVAVFPAGGHERTTVRVSSRIETRISACLLHGSKPSSSRQNATGSCRTATAPSCSPASPETPDRTSSADRSESCLVRFDGAGQESTLPSRGLHDLAGLEQRDRQFRASGPEAPVALGESS